MMEVESSSTSSVAAQDSEFQRAKSFWQTRTARSQSQTKDSSPPQSSKSASSADKKRAASVHAKAQETSSCASSSSFAKRIAPFANATPVAPAVSVAASAQSSTVKKEGNAADFRPSIVPASGRPVGSAHVAESPMTPAPDHTMPPTPSPSVSMPPPTTTSDAAASEGAGSKNAPINVVNSMFKTFSEAKLFGTTSNSSASDNSSDAAPKENGSQMTLPSLPVQLPDMSTWKEKMKSYGNNKSKASSSSSSSRMNLSFANISSSWKSMSTLSHSSTGSNDGSSPKKSSSPTAGAGAKQNIHNPCHRTKATSNPITSGSPYGELIVAEILAAKDLTVGDFIQGESDPYVVVRYDDKEKHSTVSTSTLHPVYNERFVFWVPSSPSIDEQVVSITVMNKNMVIPDEHLGEVHLSLAIPVNEAFDEWYPLVKEDGSKKGSVRVGVRRMVLTSPSLLLAAQALAAKERSLNDDDLTAHGSTIPELWYGFAEAQEPVFDDGKPKQTDVIASKLNHLSRRFIGIELTSSSETKRNVF